MDTGESSMLYRSGVAHPPSCQTFWCKINEHSLVSLDSRGHNARWTFLPRVNTRPPGTIVVKYAYSPYTSALDAEARIMCDVRQSRRDALVQMTSPQRPLHSNVSDIRHIPC